MCAAYQEVVALLVDLHLDLVQAVQLDAQAVAKGFSSILGQTTPDVLRLDIPIPIKLEQKVTHAKDQQVRVFCEHSIHQAWTDPRDQLRNNIAQGPTGYEAMDGIEPACTGSAPWWKRKAICASASYGAITYSKEGGDERNAHVMGDGSVPMP